jgi:integrase/recombinase XerD
MSSSSSSSDAQRTSASSRSSTTLTVAGSAPGITVIALWLGHEQITTTQIYLHADMSHKQQAIERTRPLGVKPGRYRPSDTMLTFLQAP